MQDVLQHSNGKKNDMERRGIRNRLPKLVTFEEGTGSNCKARGLDRVRFIPTPHAQSEFNLGFGNIFENFTLREDVHFTCSV